VAGPLLTVCGLTVTWADLWPAYARPLCPTCRAVEPDRSDLPKFWAEGEAPVWPHQERDRCEVVARRSSERS
jgi:hypothetical protein